MPFWGTTEMIYWVAASVARFLPCVSLSIHNSQLIIGANGIYCIRIPRGYLFILFYQNEIVDRVFLM